MVEHIKPLPVIFSLLIAAILQLIPLPDFAANARPLWVAMTVLYWNISAPTQVNIGVSWLAGLVLDILSGSPLGQHALGMVCMSYIGIRLHKEYRLYSILQRLFLVFSALLLFQIITGWIWAIDGHPPSAAQFWMPLGVSILLWVWYQNLLDWISSLRGK